MKGREAAIYSRPAISKAGSTLCAYDPAQHCVVGEETSQAPPTLEPEKSADADPDQPSGGRDSCPYSAGQWCCGDDHADAT